MHCRVRIKGILYTGFVRHKVESRNLPPEAKYLYRIFKMQNIFTLVTPFPAVYHEGSQFLTEVFERSLTVKYKKIIQNRAFRSYRYFISQLSKGIGALQLWLSRTCFHLIITTLFKLWGQKNISKCTKTPPEDLVMPLILHFVTTEFILLGRKWLKGLCQRFCML